jgi:putative tryptophan/tyrosine transport system substrate-binding protein
MSDMKRREFITLLGGAAATWPIVARAQPSAEVFPRRPNVGFLAAGSKAANRQFYDGLPQGMRELGYIEGRDYEIAYRYADGDLARLPALAQELVHLAPNVIVAAPGSAVLAARKATASIPIVGVNMFDPVGMGLLANEARPGSNVTGVLVRVPGQAGKQLEIARDAVTGARRIGVLGNLDEASNVLQWRETEAAAAKLGMTLSLIEARTPDEISPAFGKLAGERPDVVIVLGQVTFVTVRRQIAAFALAARLPTVYSFREHVEDGGLISYGINLRANYRRAAFYVDRILKGEKAADLPVEFPTKVELVVNVATAKALGLEIPASLLAIADEVIE